MKPLLSNNLKNLLGQVNTKSLQKIRVDLIDPDPDQPRKQYTQEQIEERGRSLESQGQLQPIEVTETDNGRYKLVFGELRWRGAQHIGWEELDAIVNTSDLDAGARLARQLVENLQRDDMPAMDTARAVQKLVELKGSAAEVSRALGKSEGQISKYLAVLDLPPAAAELAESKITRDVETLATIGKIERTNPQAARELVDDAKKKGKISRNEAREVAQEVSERSKPPAAVPPKKSISKKRQAEIAEQVAGLQKQLPRHKNALEKVLIELIELGEFSEESDSIANELRSWFKQMARR